MLNEKILEKITTVFGTPNASHFDYLWAAKVSNYYKQEVYVAAMKPPSFQLQ